MGCFTGRCLLFTICALQFVSTIERLVFDFLGYMWVPIIGGFLQILFVIMGFFGTYQYRPKVLVVYCVWLILWLAWNIFIICFYLEVGILSRDDKLLSLGTNTKSWWLENGIGCYIINEDNLTSSASPSSATSRLIPAESNVAGCLIVYYYVEIIHAGVQCLLCLIAFVVSCYVIYIFTEEDDSSQPVHDELEYIKMRYKSPARSSFRDNKTYETLTSRSTYSTVDRIERHGLDGPHHSDDSYDRFSKGSRSPLDRDGKHCRPWIQPPQQHQQRLTTLQQDFTRDFNDPSFTSYNIIGQTTGVTVI